MVTSSYEGTKNKSKKHIHIHVLVLVYMSVCFLLCALDKESIDVFNTSFEDYCQ